MKYFIIPNLPKFPIINYAYFPKIMLPKIKFNSRQMTVDAPLFPGNSRRHHRFLGQARTSPEATRERRGDERERLDAPRCNFGPARRHRPDTKTYIQ